MTVAAIAAPLLATAADACAVGAAVTSEGGLQQHAASKLLAFGCAAMPQGAGHPNSASAPQATSALADAASSATLSITAANWARRRMLEDRILAYPPGGCPEI